MRSSRRSAARFVAGGLLLVLLPHLVSASRTDASAGSQALQQQRAAQLQAITPEQRTQFGQRVAAWNALPLAEREDRRARYQAWLQLQESERIRLRAVAAEFAAFPLERQQALRTQFDALDDSQRRGWRLGIALGADYEKLHSLLAYVPADQRLSLLAALRAMTAQQRADLAVLVQRTPPQDRQALRASLAAQPPTQLAMWLQRRLAQ